MLRPVMRQLLQPRVAKSAALAASLTAFLCLPRFLLWEEKTRPLWYLLAVAFCGSFVLWAFIFAWHSHYTQRPVFTTRIDLSDWGWATVAGIVASIVLQQFLDPALRRTTPQDYPANVPEWMAMALFSLALNQVFLIFAPLAWLMRLFRRIAIAVALTVAFDMVVLLLKAGLSSEPFPPGLLAGLLGVRLVLGLLAIGFYLRGGVLLASWFALLVQARHLAKLML